MRPNRGKVFGLALLLALGMSGGMVRADDDAILSGGNLLTQQQAKAPSQQQAAAPADDTLPADVEADLREQIADLQAEVDEMKQEIQDMKALQQRDERAFQQKVQQDEARIAQLEKQRQGGVAGTIDRRVNGGIDGSNGGRNQPSNGNRNNTNNNNNNNTNNNNASNQQRQDPQAHMKWWEKLLLAVAQGVGKALESWADKKLGVIHNNADRASQQLGDKYPQHRQVIDQRVHDAVQERMTGQRPQPQVTRPVTATPPYVSTQVTVIRRYEPLPRVTDENGTHPMINLPFND